MRLLPLAATALLASGGLTVGVSSPHAGARGVVLKLEFTTELQCGRPIGPPIVVALPAAEHVPRRISRSSILVSGTAPEAVSVLRHSVLMKISRPQVICDVIGPGPVTILFTRAAKLGNPAQRGTYHASVRRGTQTVRGTFTVTT